MDYNPLIYTLLTASSYKRMVKKKHQRMESAFLKVITIYIGTADVSKYRIFKSKLIEGKVVIRYKREDKTHEDASSASTDSLYYFSG